MGLFNKKYILKKNKNLVDSFKHAYEGIVYVFAREKNMHIHITVSIIVIVCGALFEITYIEWLTCFLLIALVISLEMINTSIEATVDLITTEDNKLAKVAKDASAGAVFFASIISAGVGIIIFMPKTFDFLIKILV